MNHIVLTKYEYSATCIIYRNRFKIDKTFNSALRNRDRNIHKNLWVGSTEKGLTQLVCPDDFIEKFSLFSFGSYSLLL